MQKKHADFRRKRKFHARKLNGQQEPGAVERKGWPAGAPPFVLKRAQALASLVVTDQLRLSNDPYSYQRLRDFKIHIYERKRHSGALFQDKENPTKHQLPAVSSTPNLRASNSIGGTTSYAGSSIGRPMTGRSRSTLLHVIVTKSMRRPSVSGPIAQ
jgi:hypothetical protein